MQNRNNWPALLILILLISGAGLFLLSALSFGTMSLYMLVMDGEDPAGAMIASLATGFEAALIGVAAWSVFRKYNGRAEEETLLRLPFATWHILILLAVMGSALVFGTALSLIQIKILAWFVLPLLTLVLIIPPIWILLGLGTSELDFGPRWRAFGIFGIGLTLGPLVMITLEFALLLVLIVVAVILLARRPEMIAEFTRIVSGLENETDPNVILTRLAPYFLNPIFIQVAVGFIALAVPMIEEMFKPLGVWLFARKIDTPAQGFALGLLSGAAYAMFESLGASGRGDISWALVVSIRAGTSLLHIVTSGLMGWAIVAAFRQRKYWGLAGTYAVVTVLHGIWNASAAGAGFAAVSDFVQDTSWALSVIPAAVCGMSVMMVGMVALLIVLNRRVRKLSTVEIAELDLTPDSPNSPDAEGVK